jgi:hypothetical protein
LRELQDPCALRLISTIEDGTGGIVSDCAG